MTDTEQPSYVPPRFLEEVKSTFAPIKQRTYDLMRLAPGDAALDVGCGPGTDTFALAELVGLDGRVAGIDRDAGMIQVARELAASQGVANVEHLQGDAARLPFEDGAFHACRSERVFQHIADPEPAAREVARVLQPGGYVVLADPDLPSMSMNTTDTEFEWRIKQMMCDLLPNGYAAIRNLRLLKRAGFESISVEIRPIVFYGYEPFGILLRAPMDHLLEATGLPLSRFQEVERAARQADAQGQFLGCMNMILTSGRKPLGTA